MFGLILATCLTTSPHCQEPGAIKYDIIDAFDNEKDCTTALSHEPAWRQRLLICDTITKVSTSEKSQ